MREPVPEDNADDGVHSITDVALVMTIHNTE